jgi:uncharacterized protein (AIM24 family)
MTDVEQRIQCRWCHAQSPSSARTCDRCGAPLDVRDAVTDSGWREAPRLRDLTQFHWSASGCQLDTGVVPVAEVTLAGEDTVFFEHHAMLWKDETVPMSVLSTPGGARRLVSGMPFVLSVAHAPGKVAFSRDATGELVVIPVEAPAEVDVREHALVLASGSLAFTYEKIGGFRVMLAADAGMYLDRFVAQTAPGLLVLHGYGNVFQRTLGEGETILVDPGAFFYKDSKVTMEVTSINMKGKIEDNAAAAPAPAGDDVGGPAAAAAAAPAAEPAKKGGMFGRLKSVTSMVNVGGLAQAAGQLRSGGGIGGVASALVGGGGATMFRMTGPGRVGIQSMFQPHKTGSE